MDLKALTLEGLDYFKGLFDTLLVDKVDKVTGKGLSANDYTTVEKSKLTAIEAGAQVNDIEGIKVSGVAVTPVAKVVNIDLTGYATKADISTVYKPKGTKPNVAGLPTTGNVIGDVWNVDGDGKGANYVWEGTKWDKLSETVDLSAYATTASVTAGLGGKVDKVDGKGLSTNDYTAAEKTKLAGLNNYTHPTSDGNKHVPANGTTNAGKFLMAGAVAGSYTWNEVPLVTPITNAEIDSIFKQ